MANTCDECGEEKDSVKMYFSLSPNHFCDECSAKLRARHGSAF